MPAEQYPSDKNSTPLKMGDKVTCGDEKHRIEFKIEKFDKIYPTWLAHGKYGGISVKLLEKIEE